MARRDGPPTRLRRAVTEWRQVLREAVPVDRRVLVWHIVEHSDPDMFSLFEPQQRPWRGACAASTSCREAHIPPKRLTIHDDRFPGRTIAVDGLLADPEDVVWLPRCRRRQDRKRRT